MRPGRLRALSTEHRNAIANTIGFGSGVVLALVGVAVLPRLMEPDAYRNWLVVSAVPTYLVLSDLGVGSAGSVRMTLYVAQSRLREAATVFGSVAVFGPGAMLVLGCAAAAVGWLVGLGPFASLTVTVPLVLWVVVASLSSSLEGVYRSVDRFATGVLILGGQRVVDATAVALAAAMTQGDLHTIVWAQLGGRMVTTAVSAVYARTLAPFYFGALDARADVVVSLLRPGLGFVLFPIAQAVVAQGLLLVAAATASAESVAVINIMRVLFGFVRQWAQALGFAVFTSLTRAAGRGDAGEFGRLSRWSRRIVLGSAAGGAAVVVLLGQQAFTIVSGLPYSVPLALLVCLAVFSIGDALWSSTVIRAMSFNGHLPYTALQTVIALLVVVLAWATALQTKHEAVIWAAFAVYGVLLGAASWYRRPVSLSAGVHQDDEERR